MSKYLYTEKDGTRSVYRIDGQNATHFTVSVPLFVCWGSTFHGWGRTREISKAYINRQKASPYIEMPKEMARKYDKIKKGDSSSVLFK